MVNYNRIHFFNNSCLSITKDNEDKYDVILTKFYNGIFYQEKRKILYRSNWVLLIDEMKRKIRFNTSIEV